jgi:hypothetical protein
MECSRIWQPARDRRRYSLTRCLGAVFTEAKFGITDPGLFQRPQFCPDLRFVGIKWSGRRNLFSHWLLWRAGLWFQPIVSDILYCRKKLFMNSTNFQQKIHAHSTTNVNGCNEAVVIKYVNRKMLTTWTKIRNVFALYIHTRQITWT